MPDHHNVAAVNLDLCRYHFADHNGPCRDDLGRTHDHGALDHINDRVQHALNVDDGVPVDYFHDGRTRHDDQHNCTDNHCHDKHDVPIVDDDLHLYDEPDDATLWRLLATVLDDNGRVADRDALLAAVAARYGS